jgi:predicted alpha/beta superfamily hydrolase
MCALIGAFAAHRDSTFAFQTPNSAKDSAKISFHVRVPQGTPAQSKLYMAGNLDALGPWQPDVFPLTRVGPLAFEGELNVPIGHTLQYKITRGSWSTVEKAIGGGEISNRILRVQGDAQAEIQVAAWAIAQQPKPNTGTGDLRWRDFDSLHLGGKRRVTVWLPASTASTPAQRLPVVYFLDGQNVFDGSRAAFNVEWRADESAQDLIDSGRVPPFMIVAVDNSSDRMTEYTPVQGEWQGRTLGGGADRMLSFLCDELKPQIDSAFPTQPEAPFTSLIGSSLGGLLVLHAVRERSDVFGGGAAMSPSLFWGGEHANQSFSDWQPRVSPSRKTKLWLDTGTRESESASTQSRTVDHFRQFIATLGTKHQEYFEMQFRVIADAEHNELAWSRRLPDVFEFLLNGNTR